MAIDVIDKIKPMGKHFIADAEDIEYSEESMKTFLDMVKEGNAKPSISVTVTAEGWQDTEGSAPYTQSVTEETIKSTHQVKNIILDKESVTTEKEEDELKSAFNRITYLDTEDGTIKFTAQFKKPEKDVKILLVF